jgi:hypothetical protein
MVFKDQQLLAEAYNLVSEKKHKCMHAAKGCDCAGCSECKANQEPIEEAKKKAKPDHLDVDKDGDKKESMKKALKDKKEVKEQLSSFKALFNKVIAEGKKEYSMKGAFGPKVKNPHEEEDQKKLEKLRKKRKEESASKKK